MKRPGQSLNRIFYDSKTELGFCFTAKRNTRVKRFCRGKGSNFSIFHRFERLLLKHSRYRVNDRPVVGGGSGRTTPFSALKGNFSADCSSANILNIVRL